MSARTLGQAKSPSPWAFPELPQGQPLLPGPWTSLLQRAQPVLTSIQPLGLSQTRLPSQVQSMLGHPGLQ